MPTHTPPACLPILPKAWAGLKIWDYDALAYRHGLWPVPALLVVPMKNRYVRLFVEYRETTQAVESATGGPEVRVGFVTHFREDGFAGVK